MRGDQRTLGHLKGVSRADVAVPQPVIAEIVYGIARLPRSRRRRVLEERLALVRSELTTAEWTEAVSDALGGIKAALEHKGERIVDFDAAIAAHALASHAVLVTANARHMRRISGIEIEDWGKEYAET
jgi:tRNA(fMet)-specific endonuclease VapC